METNILTKKLVIYTNCYFDGKNYYPKEIRGAINKNQVLATNEDVKVLKDLKHHIELTEPWYNSPLLICNNPEDEEDKYMEFNVGEPVIYQNGDKFELGIVKSVCGNAEYFVNYHTGDTAARTHARHLHKISNSYAFHIYRLDTEDNERR